MNMKNLSPTEFKTDNEDEAEFFAILSDRIPYFDEGSGEYKLLDQKEIRSKVKNFYAKERYEDAEELIDALDRFQSINLEKEFRQVKSRSYRFSEVQFVKVVKKAYERDTSVSDVLRFNMANKLEEGVDYLYQNSSIEGEKLDIVHNILSEWSEKEGRGPKKDGYNLGYHFYYTESQKKYKQFAKYYVKKNVLKNKIDDEKLIDIYLKYYDIADPGALLDYTDIIIKEDKGNLYLQFDHSINFIFECYSLDDLNNFLSDVANQGYSKNELRNLPVFNDFFRLSDMVQSIKEGEDDQIKAGQILDQNKTWDDIHDKISFPNQIIKFPIEINDGSLRLDGVCMEKGKVKELILKDMIDDELESLNINEAKKQVEDFLEKGQANKARQIHKKITTYKSLEYWAELIESLILQSISSQVVSLTMPKGVAGLLKLFDLEKEEMIG